MDIAVTGSTGLVGTRLVELLRADGHRVARVVRPQSEAVPGDTIAWDVAAGSVDADAFKGIDAVVHLAGAGIGDKRWTAQRKRVVMDSRVDGTTLLSETLAGLDRPPGLLLSASAVGWYGDTGDTVTDESAEPRPGDFQTEVCRAWEGAATAAVDAGIRTAFLRSGAILDPGGGALGAQLLAFKLCLGGRAGSGRQWFSWMHVDDDARAIAHLLTDPGASEVSGPVNLTSPNPVTNAEFARALGRAVHRPTFVVPMLAPRLLYGRELADSLLLTSQRIVPSVLARTDFEFAHPDIGEALEDLVERASWRELYALPGTFGS